MRRAARPALRRTARPIARPALPVAVSNVLRVATLRMALRLTRPVVRSVRPTATRVARRTRVESAERKPALRGLADGLDFALAMAHHPRKVCENGRLDCGPCPEIDDKRQELAAGTATGAATASATAARRESKGNGKAAGTGNQRANGRSHRDTILSGWWGP